VIELLFYVDLYVLHKEFIEFKRCKLLTGSLKVVFNVFKYSPEKNSNACRAQPSLVGAHRGPIQENCGAGSGPEGPRALRGPSWGPSQKKKI